MTILSRLFAALAAACLLAQGAIAHAPQGVLRVSAIPDENPTELQRKFRPLGAYLERKTGMKVVFTPVTDYAASVEGLVNRKLDLVWFGGFTFVQANVRSKGKVVPLVQRAEDEKFRSVFVTTAPDIRKLADLRGRTFAFGSESSTSGHLMPRSAMLAAGIRPESDLARVAYSGAHDATAAAVAGGKVDAGALNASVWEKLVSERKVDPAQVRVFHTTATYYDYNWSVHADMPAALKKRITDAFLSLDASTPEGREILALQRATRFIPTHAGNYAAIEAAARNAGLLR